MSKTVFVGLSGGVDSAVSAMLLKEQGFNVVGVFIKIWQPEFTECTWAEDRVDAMRVAVSLQIPFREIDLSLDYEKEVVENMVSGYSRGITPNPDVLCNRSIKFGSFLQYAESEGADFIATGHYARVACGDRGLTQKEFKSDFKLLRGVDKNKDQSYFLYTLGQSDLARALFPVGGLLKSEVRKLARRFALPVAARPDSQGLCFVGDVTMKEFLSRFITLKKGAVLERGGAVIGTHDGAALYTVGQRHGFLIEGKDVERVPHYVVSVDVVANTICVSARREDAAREKASVDSMHWIGEVPAMPLHAQTQARYREEPRDAAITIAGSGAKIIFNEPHIAAPGQSLVVYEGERCLGGGVIQKS